MTTWLHQPDNDPDHQERTRRELDDPRDREERERERQDRFDEKSDVDPWLPRPHRLARRQRQQRGSSEAGAATVSALLAVLTDALDELEPRAWFSALEPGARITPRGFTHCPLHPDALGTLQLGHRPGDGWWCWGCARGGDLPRYLALREASSSTLSRRRRSRAWPWRSRRPWPSAPGAWRPSCG